MPGGFPLGLEFASSPAGLFGSSPTAGASANTKGAWSTLYASSPYDVCWIIVNSNYLNSTATNFCTDIGIGSAGNEVALVQNLNQSNFGTGDSPTSTWSFPLHIPAGTRIVQRIQSTQGGDTNAGASVQLFDGAYTQMEGVAGYDSIGFNLATTLGTAVAPNATSDVLGAFTQIIAATVRDYIGFMATIDNQGQASGGGNGYLYDIAIGSAGNEVVISSLNLHAQLVSSFHVGGGRFIPLLIPAGSRISARCLSFGGSARNIGISLQAAYL